MTALDLLYVSDDEIARMVFGRADAQWNEVVRVLEREGLPPKEPLFRDRRYKPAVLRFFERRNGMAAPDEQRDTAAEPLTMQPRRFGRGR